MNRYIRFGMLLLLATAAFLSGCSLWTGQKPDATGLPPTASTGTVTQTPTPSPNKEGPGIASNSASPQPTDPSGGDEDPGSWIDRTEDDDEDNQDFRLMGLRPGTVAAMVTALHGDPVSQFPLKDGSRTLEVLNYKTFRVGIDPDDKVAFIDVFDKTASGLGIIGIGSTAEEIQADLGTPHTLSTYVVAYKRGEVLLKFDLDAKTGRTISIKLFAASVP